MSITSASPRTKASKSACKLIANELGSKLDPALAFTERKRKRTRRRSRVARLRRSAKGIYAISIRDRDFRGGNEFRYRLHVGNVPVVTGVFPLAVQRGRTTSVHVSGVNLASDVLPASRQSHCARGCGSQARKCQCRWVKCRRLVPRLYWFPEFLRW